MILIPPNLPSFQLLSVKRLQTLFRADFSDLHRYPEGHPLEDDSIHEVIIYCYYQIVL